MAILDHFARKSRTQTRLEQIAEESLRLLRRPREIVGIQSRHGTIRFEDGRVIFDEEKPRDS